jgi:hypothetical protein
MRARQSLTIHAQTSQARRERRTSVRNAPILHLPLPLRLKPPRIGLQCLELNSRSSEISTEERIFRGAIRINDSPRTLGNCRIRDPRSRRHRVYDRCSHDQSYHTFSIPEKKNRTNIIGESRTFPIVDTCDNRQIQYPLSATRIRALHLASCAVTSMQAIAMLRQFTARREHFVAIDTDHLKRNMRSFPRGEGMGKNDQPFERCRSSSTVAYSTRMDARHERYTRSQPLSLNDYRIP